LTTIVLFLYLQFVSLFGLLLWLLWLILRLFTGALTNAKYSKFNDEYLLYYFKHSLQGFGLTRLKCARGCEWIQAKRVYIENTLILNIALGSCLSQLYISEKNSVKNKSSDLLQTEKCLHLKFVDIIFSWSLKKQLLLLLFKL